VPSGWRSHSPAYARAFPALATPPIKDLRVMAHGFLSTGHQLPVGIQTTHGRSVFSERL
jgi:hypothetical protein